MAASKLSSLKKGGRALRSEFNYPSKVSWFPGHMDRAVKQLKESFLPNISVVVEVRDSRIPISSEHPHFNALIGDKPKLVLLNKADLLSPKHRSRLRQWIEQQNSTSSASQRFLMTADTPDLTKPLNAKHILSALHQMASDSDCISTNKHSLSGAPIHNLIVQNKCSMIGVMGYPNAVRIESFYLFCSLQTQYFSLWTDHGEKRGNRR